MPPPPPHKPPSPTTTPPDILKRRLLTLLDKLSDRDTFTQASTELQLIAQTPLLNNTNLTTFLTCLLSIDSTTTHKPAARAQSLRLISTLASHHSHSLTPHLPKILSTYIPRRLRDPDSNVRSASIDAVTSLSRHVPDTPFRHILDPLTSAIFTDQDLNVQIGAAMCLSAAIDVAPVENLDYGELRRVIPKMVKLVKTDGFKPKPPVWGLIGSVVGVNKGAVVVINSSSSSSKGLIGSVVGCAVDSLGSSDWAERKAAAEALQRLAEVEDGGEELLSEVRTLCVDSLDKRRFDKVKNVREAMNRALEAWRQVEDSLLLSRSISEDYSIGAAMSPPLPKPSQTRKKMTKSRSSLSDSSGSSPFTSSTETPQSKRTLSKSRSSLSSLSSLSDESSSNHPSSTLLTKRCSLPIINKQHKPAGQVRTPPATTSSSSSSRKQQPPVDWKIEIVVPQAQGGGGGSSFSAANLDNQDDGGSGRNEEVGDGSVTSSDGNRRSSAYYDDEESSNSRMFGCPQGDEEESYSREEEDSEAEVVDVDGVPVQLEHEYDNDNQLQDLASIRKQLFLIEKQQSTLMNLLQNFMGRSQSGIDSLETRVSGLEKALDKITHGNANGNGNDDSSGNNNNNCCMIPAAADFLSPKFWKKNEGGRFGAVPKSMPNRENSDEMESWGGIGSLHEKQQNEVNHAPKSDTMTTTASIRDLGRSREGEVSSPRLNSPRVVQPCSGAAGNGYSGAFSSPYYKPVVPRT